MATEAQERRERFKDVYGDGEEMMRLIGNYVESANKFMAPFIAALEAGDDAATDKVIQAYADAAEAK